MLDVLTNSSKILQWKARAPSLRKSANKYNEACTYITTASKQQWKHSVYRSKCQLMVHGIFFSLLRWVCEFDRRDAQSFRWIKSPRGSQRSYLRGGFVTRSYLFIFNIPFLTEKRTPFINLVKTLHPQLLKCKVFLSFSQPSMRLSALLSPFTGRNEDI